MPSISWVRIRLLMHNWFFLLILVTALAIILRSLPGWINTAWGCDFGIYYGLTNSFIKSKELFSPYMGWGSSYQYFPVLYIITGLAHWISGIDVLVLMPKLAPIFGSLSVLIFYFLIYELFHDRKKALVASLIFAVMPFHVYQTSHASPLTLGHFFMMLSLFLFIKFRQDNRYLITLIGSTLLLIMSHHLTTYIFLVSIISIVFIENLYQKQWTTTILKDILFILISSGMIFLYWILVATPVFKDFMQRGLRLGSITIGSNITILLFYIGLAFLFSLIIIQRKMNIFRLRGEPSRRNSLTKFFATIIICLGAMCLFTFVKMPWTNFSFTPLSILLSLPLIFLFAFGVAGFRYTRLENNALFIRGWLIGILLSFLYGLITNSTILYPHRHFEYLMAPLSLVSLLGIQAIIMQKQSEQIYSNRLSASNTSLRKLLQWGGQFFQKRQIVYAGVVLLLVSSNAMSVYPSHVALNASYEVITSPDIAAFEWMHTNIAPKNVIVASDHRLARLAEAYGFNTTLDKASNIWVSENLTDYIEELYGLNLNYTRITHIIIDDIMKDRVVHVGFGNICYMTNESYEKFFYSPFKLVFTNATYSDTYEEIHWVEIYAVNWFLLDSLINPVDLFK